MLFTLLRDLTADPPSPHWWPMSTPIPPSILLVSMGSCYLESCFIVIPDSRVQTSRQEMIEDLDSMSKVGVPL